LELSALRPLFSKKKDKECKIFLLLVFNYDRNKETKKQRNKERKKGANEIQKFSLINGINRMRANRAGSFDINAAARSYYLQRPGLPSAGILK
jgi:hypothetical protein